MRAVISGQVGENPVGYVVSEAINLLAYEETIVGCPGVLSVGWNLVKDNRLPKIFAYLPIIANKDPFGVSRSGVLTAYNSCR